MPLWVWFLFGLLAIGIFILLLFVVFYVISRGWHSAKHRSWRGAISSVRELMSNKEDY